MENATTNVFHASEEFWRDWHWLVALDAFDFDDPEPLADLVRNSESIPGHFRDTVAEVILRKKQPNLKAAVKLKVPARERLEIAARLSFELGVLDLYQKGPHIDLDTPREGYDRKLEHVADMVGVEPNEVRRYIERKSRDTMQATAERHGVSVATLQNWLRDLRKLIVKYQSK